jgi:cysteine-S-conjugate beta-lyase
MKYDFDCVHSRKGTSCAKWDALEVLFGSDDVIPMWVADMDFPAAEPIVEALKERASHPFYGYTQPSDECMDAIIDRMQRVFNWQIEREWIVLTPGVIPALNAAIRALARPGDEIILQEPVYYPFFPSVKQSGCQVVTNELKLENGRYEMDYDNLERCFGPRPGMHESPGRVKALVLCNPHNPIGRLWNNEEVTRLGEIVLSHNAVVISDEIHCELLYKGYKHTPFAMLSEEFAQRGIVCMAPSKTFNLAGLGASTIIIPNKQMRDDFNTVRQGVMPGPNLFALTALEAAYRYGDEWLAQLRDYLQKNLAFTLAFFNERIPRIDVIEPQGTYLLWLDCRGLGLNDEDLRNFMRERAKVGLDDGFMFGHGGSGFQRMNIACPRPLLKEALERIERAVKGL